MPEAADTDSPDEDGPLEKMSAIHAEAGKHLDDFGKHIEELKN